MNKKVCKYSKKKSFIKKIEKILCLFLSTGLKKLKILKLRKKKGIDVLLGADQKVKIAQRLARNKYLGKNIAVKKNSCIIVR